jgi:ABC-type polysaccharide/polyol phosphate export permease
MAVRALPDGWVHRSPERFWYTGSAKPTARQWWHALLVLTKHEFAARYRAQALGAVWSLLYPVVTMAILSLIFTRVFKSSVPNFPIFVLIGLLAWQLISASTSGATMTFVAHSEIIKRTVFPRILLPIAVMLSHGLNFLMASTVLLLFVPIFPSGFRLSPTLLLVPVILAFMVILLAGVALMVSVLNVIYRDVAYLVETGLYLVYWITPVFYPVEVIPEPYQTVLKCSPLTGILNALRGCIMTATPPTALMWASIVFPSLLMLGIGWLVFRHYERLVLDHV